MVEILQKVSRSEESICGKCTHKFVCKAIDNQPCFECNQFAAEVEHGHWAIINNYCCVCSVCHNASTQTYYYCPECGAKMDLEGE